MNEKLACVTYFHLNISTVVEISVYIVSTVVEISIDNISAVVEINVHTVSTVVEISMHSSFFYSNGS